MRSRTARTAEVVVIGGGVIGASIAYHLAAKGCTSVLVLERGTALGAGSTGKATGGFRAQFATPVNVRLSLLAREKLRRFEDETGVDSGYRACGYLFIADTPERLALLRDAQRVQHAAGLHEAIIVAPADIALHNPDAAAPDAAGAAFCSTDGFLRPLEIMRGYTDAARRLGVSFLCGAQVQGIRIVRDRAVAVETAQGTVHAGAVVNAAGPWAASVAALAGTALPVTPVRRQIACTEPCGLLPATMPMTIFTADGFHLRVRDGRVLLLWPGPAEPHLDAEIGFDERWLPDVLARARHHVPSLAAVRVDRAHCVAGLYEMSPDGHAILGAAPRIENFFLANGSSGHGVMHAPALGHLLAELLLDGAAWTMDVSALRPERFATGDACTVPDLF